MEEKPKVCMPGEECAGNKIIRVYWREGCSWCEKLKPQIEEMKKENPGIVFEVIDDTPRFKAGQGFQSYPTTIGFENGEQKRTVRGFTSKEAILASLNDKTIADLTVIELVRERDRALTIVQNIEIELNKRK
jgi:thiol-disulfide isomerase/thioredoxin